MRTLLGFICTASTVALLLRFLRALSKLHEKRHAHGTLRGKRGSPDDKEHALLLLGRRYMRNAQGMYLFHRCWQPSRPNGEAIVLIHGFGEHSGRYEHVAAALTSAGYQVFALDHQGHGASDGDRAYFESIWDPVADILQFVREVAQTAAGGRPLFILGHSMGGLLSTLSVLKSPELFKGLILSGPAVGPDPAKPLTVCARGVLAWLAEQLPKLSILAIPPGKTCRTKVVVQTYALDPLNYHESIRANLFFAFVQGWDFIAQHIESCKVPLLLQHGTGDELVVLGVSKEFFPKYGAANKTMCKYDGWFHEIYNECEADCDVQTSDGLVTNRAIRDAVTWLREMQASPDIAQSWHVLKGR